MYLSSGFGDSRRARWRSGGCVGRLGKLCLREERRSAGSEMGVRCVFRRRRVVGRCMLTPFFFSCCCLLA